MQNLSKHDGRHDQPTLQKTVRTSETKRGNLKAIRAEEQNGKKYTIGEHEFLADRLPNLHLIVLDDQGNGTPPEGTTIAFKGKAWIENTEKAVGICR